MTSAEIHRSRRGGIAVSTPAVWASQSESAPVARRGAAPPWPLQLAQGAAEGLNFAFIGERLPLEKLQHFQQFLHVVKRAPEGFNDLADVVNRLFDARLGAWTWQRRTRWWRRRGRRLCSQFLSHRLRLIVSAGWRERWDRSKKSGVARFGLQFLFSSGGRHLGRSIDRLCLRHAGATRFRGRRWFASSSTPPTAAPAAAIVTRWVGSGCFGRAGRCRLLVIGSRFFFGSHSFPQIALNRLKSNGNYRQKLRQEPSQPGSGNP